MKLLQRLGLVMTMVQKIRDKSEIGSNSTCRKQGNPTKDSFSYQTRKHTKCLSNKNNKDCEKKNTQTRHGLKIYLFIFEGCSKLL